MTHTPGINRPDKDLVAALADIGTASIATSLSRMGIRSTSIVGPRPLVAGRSIAGPALTLKFMPIREDLYGVSEFDDPESQLHRHVLYHVQAGDVVVVDGRGDLTSGIFGDMMLTYFAGRGGAGVVVDGCIRDSRKAKALDTGIWVSGVTPNYHTQTNLMPFAVNEPIACGGVTVIPGDIIVADDDGVVVVPVKHAVEVLDRASHHNEWEDFSRLKLSQGEDLRRYYPLIDAARPEYEAWKTEQPKSLATGK